jgi:hypothetical protein
VRFTASFGLQDSGVEGRYRAKSAEVRTYSSFRVRVQEESAGGSGHHIYGLAYRQSEL